MTVPSPSVAWFYTRAMPCPCIMDRCKLAQSRFNLDLIWFWSRLKGVLQSALYTLLVGLQLYWLVYILVSILLCCNRCCFVMVCMWMCTCECVLCVCLREWLNYVNVRQFLLSFHLLALQVVSYCIYAYVSIVVATLSWIQHQLKHSYLGITSLYPWS